MMMRACGHIPAFVALTLAPFLALAQRTPHLQAQWQESAIVDNDYVRLSDLLAPATDAQIRTFADKFDLGRAPEPGSVRVFTAAELQNAIHESLSLDLPTQVIVRRAGWPLSRNKLNAALNAASLPVNEVNVLGSPMTRTPDAAFRVTSTLSSSDPNALLVRFVCSMPSDCAPFWGQIKSAGNFRQNQPSRRMRFKPEPRVAPLVSPAQMAVLISEEPGMEIRLRVRPLTRAEIGDAVKVFDPESRRTFLARVKATNLVVSDLKETR